MLGNLVLEGCNAPGTGPLNLTGPAPGRTGFVQTFGTAKCFYAVTDGVQTEEGWTTASNTLTRNVIWNTAGTSAPLNFTSACQVYCPLPAQRALWADDSSIYQAQGRRLANLGAGVAVSDAMRLDQAGTLAAGLTVQQTSFGSLVVELPQTPDVVSLDLRSLVPNGSAGMYMRVSIDGGQTFLNGSSEYSSFFLYNSGNTVTTNGITTTFALLTPNMATSFPVSGIVRVDLRDRLFNGVLNGAGTISVLNGFWSTPGTPTHIIVGFVGIGLLSGTIKASRTVFA